VFSTMWEIYLVEGLSVEGVEGRNGGYSARGGGWG
jgi:hypothetical protein